MLNLTQIVSLQCGPFNFSNDLLGRANEVEMKDEILENVGKKELLQNTEHEEHSEETKEQEIVQKCLEIKTLHADGNAEAEKITEGKVASTLILSSGLEEPVKGHSEHVSEVVCSLENSGVAELRNEGGLMGDTTEVEESEQADHGNILVTQNKVAVPGIESNSEVNIGLEKTFQQQNNEKQKDVLTDEAEGNNEKMFQEALEFVNNSHVGISSQLTLAEDTLSKVPCIDSNIEQPCNNERENAEEKVAASDLKRQLVEDKWDIKITEKAQWDKNGAGETKGNETENAFQEPETKVAASAPEQTETCSGDRIQDEFVEEQKQVEEIQFLPSKHNSFVKEEQNEQELKESESNSKKSLAEESNKKEALLRDFDSHSDSEKNNGKNTMKEVPTEQTVADVVSLSKCWAGNEKDFEENCRKSREIKSEFTDDTLANTQTMHDTDDSRVEECNPTQTEDCPIGEQNVDKQDEAVQDLSQTIQMGKLPKGAEEAKNYSEAEKEVLEFVPDIQEAACPTTQKAKFSDQVGKPDSEEEEVSEEYHEAFDFDESSFGELNTTERRSNSQDKEEETNSKIQKGAGIEESAGQNVITDNYEKECRTKTKEVTEENPAITYQKSAGDVVNDDEFTEGEENIQQGKIEESEEAKCFKTDPFVESPKPISELSEDPNKQLSDEISVKEVVQCTLEQLNRLGSSVDENLEEVQVGRKGKGKSREDCVMS